MTQATVGHETFEQKWEREKAERMAKGLETRAACRAIADAIAAELSKVDGLTYRAEFIGDNDACIDPATGHTVIPADSKGHLKAWGLSVNLGGFKKAGRVSVSVSSPAVDRWLGGAPWDLREKLTGERDATVDASKPVDRIAKEVVRRLLPGLQEWRKLWAEREAELLAGHERYCATVKAACAALGVKVPLLPHEERDGEDVDWRLRRTPIGDRVVLSPLGCRRAFDVTVDKWGGACKVEVSDFPVEHLAALLALVPKREE